jgi:O-antigen ligase
VYSTAYASTTAKTELALVWLFYLAGGVIVLALTAKPALVPAAAAAAVVVVAAVRFPEAILVFFLVIGSLKPTELGAQIAQFAPAGFDLSALAGLATVGAIAIALRKQWVQPFGLPLAAVFFLALVVLLLVGAFYSPDPAGGLRKALTFEIFSALAFLAPLAIVRTRASFYRTLVLVVAVGVAVALTVQPAERSASLLVLPGGTNQIQVGLLLGLAVVSIVAYLWPASSGWLRLAFLPPLALVLTKLFSAGGRSALVGTLLACTVGTLWLLRSGRRNRIAALALVGLLAALIPAAWITTAPTVKERYLVTIADMRGGAGLDSGGAERTALADAAVETFDAHPLGAGTAGYTALTGYEWPHNIVLELASELGLLGVAVFFALVAGIVAAAVHAARSPTLRTEAIGAASLLLLPLAMAFASFDLNGNRILWFACGLALASTRLVEGTPS